MAVFPGCGEKANLYVVGVNEGHRGDWDQGVMERERKLRALFEPLHVAIQKSSFTSGFASYVE